jgi:hypothetical protein
VLTCLRITYIVLSLCARIRAITHALVRNVSCRYVRMYPSKVMRTSFPGIHESINYASTAHAPRTWIYLVCVCVCVLACTAFVRECQVCVCGCACVWNGHILSVRIVCVLARTPRQACIHVYDVHMNVRVVCVMCVGRKVGLRSHA